MSEEELLERICRGGAEAEATVKVLYARFGQPMLRYFVHNGTSPDEAKDILQETFISLVKGASTYSGGGTARAWIWQIARNRFTDFRRGKGRRIEHEISVDEQQWALIEETTADPAASAVGMSADECVAVGLSRFREKWPEPAFALTLHMEGLAMAEIAVQIGRTVRATTEFISQCRKRIAPYIQHCRELLKD